MEISGKEFFWGTYILVSPPRSEQVELVRLTSILSRDTVGVRVRRATDPTDPTASASASPVTRCLVRPASPPSGSCHWAGVREEEQRAAAGCSWCQGGSQEARELPGLTRSPGGSLTYVFNILSAGERKSTHYVLTTNSFSTLGTGATTWLPSL